MLNENLEKKFITQLISAKPFWLAEFCFSLLKNVRKKILKKSLKKNLGKKW